MSSPSRRSERRGWIRGPSGRPYLFVEFIQQCDRVDGAGASGVEHGLVVAPLGVDDYGNVIIAQVKDLGGDANAFAIAGTEAAIDLNLVRHGAMVF